MEITINGSGTVTGISVGGLPDGIVDDGTLATDAVTNVKIADNAVDLAEMASGTDGQIITYDASGNPTAVGPGTDGQVLTSTGSTTPPAFEAAAAGGIMQTPYFAAKVSSNQTVAHGVWTKVAFNSEILDSDGCYDNSTNYRFLPTTAGDYMVYVETNIHDLTSGYYMVATAYKNGSRTLAATSAAGGGQNVAQSCLGIISMNGTSDYIEGYVRTQVNTGDKSLLANGSTATPHFMAWRIG
jgi:hypothetical protein